METHATKREMIESAVEKARKKFGIEDKLNSVQRVFGNPEYQIQVWLEGQTTPIVFGEGDYPDQEHWDYAVSKAFRRHFSIAGMDSAPPTTKAGWMGGI